MQATKQRAKVDPLMQEVHMQATKQLADVAYEAVFPEPGWVEKGMQRMYCSRRQQNTPLGSLDRPSSRWSIEGGPSLG